LEAAKDKVQEEFKYDSEEYRNEPASLNHEYYTKRGKEELEQCRNVYNANYKHCRSYKTCNFCSANTGCGWCDEKKICVPLDLNSHKDELIPLCMGDCIKVLKIEYCFKGLFEPDNTQNEVNFANYDQVLNQEKYAKSPNDPIILDDEEDSSFENIMEKTFERNLIESHKVKKDFHYNFVQKSENEINNNNNNQDRGLSAVVDLNNNNNLNQKNQNFNRNNNNFLENSLNLLEKNMNQSSKSRMGADASAEVAAALKTGTETAKLETESLESQLSREFKTNSFDQNEAELQNTNTLINTFKPDCDEASNGVNGVQTIIPIPNDPSLNFIPKSYTNYPSNVDLHKNSQKLYKEMAQLSKEAFDSLLSKELKSRKKTNFIKANLDEGPQTEDEFLKYLKEFVPNFEFPQFIKSDLEQSINDIKREKLLLWLRGFSLNDQISKIHLPIYKNLSFTNEDQIRKLFLDKFYKDIVKDKNTNVDSVMYKNMLGNYGRIVPSPGNISLGKYVGMRPQDIIKDLKVVDSTYIDTTDLIGLVHQSNMRFKQKVNRNDSAEVVNDVNEGNTENANQPLFLEIKKEKFQNEAKTRGNVIGKSKKMKRSLKDIKNDLKKFLNEIK